jgi:hypothetical protein
MRDSASWFYDRRTTKEGSHGRSTDGALEATPPKESQDDQETYDRAKSGREEARRRGRTALSKSRRQHVGRAENCRAETFVIHQRVYRFWHNSQ